MIIGIIGGVFLLGFLVITYFEIMDGKNQAQSSIEVHTVITPKYVVSVNKDQLSTTQAVELATHSVKGRRLGDKLVFITDDDGVAYGQAQKLPIESIQIHDLDETLMRLHMN